ncbi:MAG: PEP-CTERM sorting domain-containing protein [Sedimentisphaerales bacterium]|nr:PEP-CTERM sorting domain-containing protein [Sedimentisphaerales bacterium]
MKKMKTMLAYKKMLSLCTVIVLVLCSGVFADDLRPPDWRGHDDSTFQLWNFSTPDLEPLPDIVENPFGSPILRVNPFDGQWMELPGAWPLSGEIDVYIPNYPEIRPYKEIWIQLTWMPVDLNPDPFLPNAPVIGVTPFDTMQMTRGDDIDLGNGWTNSLFMVTLWPNPTEEWITIKGNIVVDQLVIDTICIPEPATVIILGIGGVLALKRKKRKR